SARSFRYHDMFRIIYIFATVTAKKATTSPAIMNDSARSFRYHDMFRIIYIFATVTAKKATTSPAIMN
ncbi:hypothetical protein CQA14_26890, partial [Escherichia coli]